MKGIRAILILVFAAGLIFVANPDDLMQFKGKIGFTKAKTSIITYKFSMTAEKS